jgi:hypothetical protein
VMRWRAGDRLRPVMRACCKPSCRRHGSAATRRRAGQDVGHERATASPVFAG